MGKVIGTEMVRMVGTVMVYFGIGIMAGLEFALACVQNNVSHNLAEAGWLLIVNIFFGLGLVKIWIK